MPSCSRRPGVPAPESWLAVTIDNRLPSLQGPETHAEQSTTIQLERAFFANGPAVYVRLRPVRVRQSELHSANLRRGLRASLVGSRHHGSTCREANRRGECPDDACAPVLGLHGSGRGFRPAAARWTWLMAIDRRSRRPTVRRSGLSVDGDRREHSRAGAPGCRRMRLGSRQRRGHCLRRAERDERALLACAARGGGLPAAPATAARRAGGSRPPSSAAH